MSLEYNKELIPRAKELRANATPQEKRLWYDFLCKYPLRFQRQKAIKSFIVDYYCHKAKLVVELDGSQHYSDQGRAYDAERTSILKSLQLVILRFPNGDIDRRFEAVCQKIDDAVQLRLKQLTQKKEELS